MTKGIGAATSKLIANKIRLSVADLKRRRVLGLQRVIFARIGLAACLSRMRGIVKLNGRDDAGVGI